MNIDKYNEMCDFFEKFTNNTSVYIKEMPTRIKYFASESEVNKRIKEWGGTMPAYYNLVIRPMISILADRVISMSLIDKLNWDYYYQGKAAAEELFEVVKENNVEL